MSCRAPVNGAAARPIRVLRYVRRYVPLAHLTYQPSGVVALVAAHRHALVAFDPLRHPHGGLALGRAAAFHQLTAQKQASQYARSLIEASLDPLVTISPEGKITDVNEATAKVTGAVREKLI